MLNITASARRFRAKSHIDPYALNQQRNKDVWIALDMIISFRNFPTGAGAFRTGYQSGSDYKLSTGQRNSFMLMLGVLKRMVEEGPASPQACQEFCRIHSAINGLDSQITGRITPAIKQIAAEVARTYPHEAHKYTHPLNHKYKTEVYSRIVDHEAETLIYLGLIDKQIDALLDLFGLTKKSRIIFSDDGAVVGPAVSNSAWRFSRTRSAFNSADMVFARKLRGFFGLN